MARERMTIERLSKLFKNNFALVNKAIELARHYMKEGYEFSIDTLLEDLYRDPEGKLLHEEEFEDDKKQIK